MFIDPIIAEIWEWLELKVRDCLAAVEVLNERMVGLMKKMDG